MAEGWRLVREALDSPGAVELVLMTAAFAGSAEGESLLSAATVKGIPVHSVSENQIDKLSDTVTSQGVLAVITLPSYSIQTVVSGTGPGGVLVALDGIADPGNIGTIVRTCAWFGVDGLFLAGQSVEMANPKVIRATMGAVFHIPIVEKVDLPMVLEHVRGAGFQVVVTSADGDTERIRPTAGERILLVFGNEATGVSPTVRMAADTVLSIPRLGTGESLNVSVAAGIILHQVKSS